MAGWNRRGFLVAGGAAMLAGLSGCTGPGGTGGGTPTAGGSAASTGSAAGQNVTLQWWDHFQALAEVFKQNFTTFEDKHTGVTIKRTQTNPNKQGQALTLARQSHQLPDVFTTVGLTYPTARLVSDGWMQPVPLTAKDLPALPPDSLFEGLTKFDDKIYSFPMFSPRQYSTTTWYNKDLLDKADIDAGRDLASWDTFRASARAVHKKTSKAYGILLPIQLTGRMGQIVGELANTLGGFGGIDTAIDPRTGEYCYDTDAYQQAVEFLLALKSDGSLFPGSVSLDALNGRARWATGVAALFFDGPWNIGIVKQSFPSFTDKVGVASIPSAKGAAPLLYVPPEGGTFWLSGESQHAELVAQLFTLFATESYYKALAAAMDQPPINLDIVASSDALPSYKQAIAMYAKQVKIAPSAAVRNPVVSDVLANTTEVTPDLGHIVQGVLTGQITNIRKSLKSYNDKLTAAREQAIKKVTATGKQVSLDDWKFPNWTPDQDYTPEMYQN